MMDEGGKGEDSVRARASCTRYERAPPTQLSEKYFHGLDPSATTLTTISRVKMPRITCEASARARRSPKASTEQISSTAMATIASMMMLPNVDDLASLSHLLTMRSPAEGSAPARCDS